MQKVATNGWRGEKKSAIFRLFLPFLLRQLLASASSLFASSVAPWPACTPHSLGGHLSGN